MNPAYFYIAGTVSFTVYGQLIVKWQTDRAGGMPADFDARLRYILTLVSSPWMISAFLATLIAAVAWIGALNHLELSRAYPFVAASFVLVLGFSALLFNEPMTVPKVVGGLLIVAGLIVGSQG